MSLIWPLYSCYVTSVLGVRDQRRLLRSVGSLELAAFPNRLSSSSIGTTTPSWVLACPTIVEPSQQEGFYRVLLPAARQTNVEDQ